MLDNAHEVRAGAVHLVDKRKPRHVILIGLTPDSLRLWLDSTDRAEHGDGAIQYAQRALNFNREINMAGSVDDVDAVFRELLAHAAPETGGRRGGNRDTAFLFLFHPVHGRRAIVHFADFVRAPGVIEDALGRGRFAGVDVRGNADIAIALNGGRASQLLDP